MQAEGAGPLEVPSHMDFWGAEVEGERKRRPWSGLRGLQRREVSLFFFLSFLAKKGGRGGLIDFWVRRT